MDIEDFLDPGEVAALRRPARPEPRDACDGCGGPITWVEQAFLCPSGCTWCADCADEVCTACSAPLQAVRRARPLPEASRQVFPRSRPDAPRDAR